MSGGKWGMALGAVLLILASPLLAPQLLAFPHKVETDIGTVWSDEPLDPDMLESAVADARSRFEASPLASDDEDRWIFITNGGWRWHYVANVAAEAFAITRPFSPAVILNDTDPVTGIIANGREIGGKRALAGVIAHEFAHGMIRRQYGFSSYITFPTWKIEGYADHVAQESSLSDDDVQQLRARGAAHPALIYYDGRKRVGAILDANGGSVDALFESE